MSSLQQAWKDTWSLTRLWFRLIPGLRARLLMLLLIPATWVAVWSAGQAGESVLWTARQGANTPVSNYAAKYVFALSEGDLGVAGISVIVGVVVVGFISPFTSGGSVALIPERDILGIRPSRAHTFFTSILTTAVSIIGFTQLVALTLIGSLLGLSGDPVGTIILCWLTWIPLLALTVMQSWTTEWMLRAWPTRTRWVVAATIFAGGTIILYLSQTVRGAIAAGAYWYSETLRQIAGTGTDGFFVTAAGLTLVTGVLLTAGWWVTLRTLQHPAHVTRRGNNVVGAHISTNKWWMLTQIVGLQIVRNKEIRRPLLVVTVLNVVGCWFVTSPQQQTSVLLTIPIVMGAAWAANVFGLLGPGMMWLSTQPSLARHLPTVVFTIQGMLSILLCSVCWIVVEVRHHIGAERMLSLMFATIVVTSIMTRAAFTQACRQPHVVRLGSRGDVVVRPGPAIGYALKNVPFAALASAVVLATGIVGQQIVVVVVVLMWVAARWAYTYSLWNDPASRAHIVTQVSAA